MQETLDKTSLRRRRARRPGQPRARGHRRQAPRRPHRPGPRRRRRRGHLPLAQRALGRRRDLAARPPRALPRRQGLDHRRRRQPHRRRGPRDQLHRQPDPRDPRPHDARHPPRPATWSTSRPTSSPSTSRSCSPAASSTAHPREGHADDGPARLALRRHHRRSPGDALSCARDHRQRLRPRQRDPRHEAPASGRGRSAWSATCCSSRSSSPASCRGAHRASRCGARPAARSSSSRHQPLRLVALAAAAPPRWRVRRRRDRAPLGDRRRAAASCSCCGVVGYAAAYVLADPGARLRGARRPRPGSSPARCSRRTAWPAAGSSSGWSGSSSTSSA